MFLTPARSKAWATRPQIFLEWRPVCWFKEEFVNKLNSWLVSIGFGLLWVVLRQLYTAIQASAQLKMMNGGPSPVWLMIVLAYFVADVGLVLAYMYILKSPLGSPMPKGFPFWYVASDTVVLVFLVHLSFLCLDHAVYVLLESVGLSFAYLIFLLGALCWAVITGLRYLSIKRLYLREG